jgi:amino acid transporter
LVVAPRWLASAAQLGPVSLTYWLLGLLLFFVPYCLAVREMSARVPGEGGIYLWTRAAFGEAHGFMVGWLYWISNVVYVPTVLLLAASWMLYTGGTAWLSLADDVSYTVAFSLAVVWGATLLNIVGLERARWLNSAGGAANWMVLMLVIVAAVAATITVGSATDFSPASFAPTVVDLSALNLFATISFAYVGIEASTIVGAEIRDVSRTLPLAILIGAVLIVAVYMAGTLALLIALPSQQIDPVAGIADAFRAPEVRGHLPGLGVLGALVLTISQIGNVSGWITSTARLPYVAGIDRYLPAAFGRLHPRWGSPYVALLLQATLISIVLLAAIAGSTLREAFQVLLDATFVLVFLTVLYMFVAWPVLRRRGKSSGSGSVVAFAASGFAVTALAIALALIPPPETEHPVTFLLKVALGSALLVGIGIGQFAYSRGRRQPAAASS